MAEEKNFENKVKKYLKDNGAYFIKFFANSMTKRGIPDILACLNGYFLAVEVKAQKGKPSDLQLYNIDQIRQAKGIAIVLYPDQFEQFKTLVELLKVGRRSEAKGWQYIFEKEEKRCLVCTT